MIILDTNVVSEPMKPRGDRKVQAWLDAQDVETLYLTATSLSELLLGAALIPAGRRKQNLTHALEDLIETLFGPRVLSFDQVAAASYAEIVSQARESGYAISVADGQIAAMAKIHGFKVATRDTKPFKATGVSSTNPWGFQP